MVKILSLQYKCTIINLDIRKDEFANLEKEYGNKIKNIYCDLSNQENKYEQILSDNGININSIDILINNAGIAFNKPFLQLS